MKTLTFILFLLACLSFLSACEEDISTIRTPEVSVDASHKEKTILQSNYLTLRFDLRGKRDGTYHVGNNPATGSKISMHIKGGKVAGFQVYRKDGNLVQPNGPSQGPGPGIPDHAKTPQIICVEGLEIYYDPVHGYIFVQHEDCDPINPVVEIIINTRY